MIGTTSKKEFFSSVLRDRKPCASADLRSEPSGDINGVMDVYVTPLGIILSARILAELEFKKGSCADFRIGDYSPARQLCGEMALVDTDKESAWCIALTHRFSIEDVMGREISLKYCNDDVCGRILPPTEA